MSQCRHGVTTVQQCVVVCVLLIHCHSVDMVCVLLIQCHSVDMVWLWFSIGGGCTVSTMSKCRRIESTVQQCGVCILLIQCHSVVIVWLLFSSVGVRTVNTMSQCRPGVTSVQQCVAVCELVIHCHSVDRHGVTTVQQCGVCVLLLQCHSVVIVRLMFHNVGCVYC